MDDLTDRRGIRQSVLGEMYDSMRGSNFESDIADIAQECENTNIKIIQELFPDHVLVKIDKVVGPPFNFEEDDNGKS